MRDFLLVFKVLFKNSNARVIKPNGKRKLPQNIFTLLCMLPFALLISVVAGLVAIIVPNVQTLSLICNVIVSVVQIFALFISMFGVMNTLYNSPDTPFLNTLPVRHAAVFFAKFALAYLNVLSLMATMLIPTLLTLSIVYAAFGGAMFYGFFALILLISVVAPILPMFIITVFSMPISYLGTFFKGKAVLKTILSLLFYVLVMVGYFLLIFFAGGDGGSGSEETDIVISQGALSGLAVFAKVMYPNKVLIDYCLGISAGKNFAISLAITVGMIAVMLLLALLFYRRINEKKLETRSETSHKAASYKQNNVITSLMKKDFLQIIRRSDLAMSSLATTILCPIITVIMYFTSNMQGDAEIADGFLNYMLKLSYLVLYTIIFLGGVNMMAMLAYSREGKGFFLSKTLPIRAKDSILAKFILSLIVPAIIWVIQIVIALALYRLDALSVLLFAICAALTIVGSSGLHIYCDMRYGNVNWATKQELKQVSQGNKGSLVVTFVIIFEALIPMILGMVLSTFAEFIGGRVAVLAIFWSVLFAMSAATCIAGVLVLHFKAEPYYNEIGERAFKPKGFGRQARRGGYGGNNMLMK